MNLLPDIGLQADSAQTATRILNQTHVGRHPHGNARQSTGADRPDRVRSDRPRSTLDRVRRLPFQKSGAHVAADTAAEYARSSSSICEPDSQMNERLSREQRLLVHQVHPAKLAADISASVISNALLWKHILAPGLVVRYLLLVLGSLLVMRFGDVERLAASAPDATSFSTCRPAWLPRDSQAHAQMSASPPALR
jgi:hypothetical protein